MQQPDRQRVFLVHGRNEGAARAMRLFLRELGLSVLEFDEVRNALGGTPFIGEIVQEGMARAQAIVVLITPDELSFLHPSLIAEADETRDRMRWQCRPNVLLEAGMALGIDRSRTILVTLGQVQLPSDLHGRYLIRMDNSDARREQLRSALEQGAGCQLGTHIPHWRDARSAGDFDDGTAALPEVSAFSPFCESRDRSDPDDLDGRRAGE